MNPTENIAQDSTSPGNSRRRWFAGLAALGGLGGLGLLAADAQAHGWGRGRGVDPEEMGRRMEWRIGRLIQHVGGTPQQKDRLVAIARSAMAELRPLREEARANRRRGMELLAATTIDRAALEQLRVARMQGAEARSRLVLRAMADAAEVFTPEQRVKAAERLSKRWRP